MSTVTHFNQLLDLIKPSELALSILLDRAQELFQLEQNRVVAEDIRKLLAEKPSGFYRLVSSYLADFPVELLETDRDKIVDGLKISVEPHFELLKVNGDGLWFRHLPFQPSEFSVESDALKLAWLNAKGIEVVPFGIYEFFRAAIVCYRAEHYPGAIALAAIAFEASLKEALRRAKRNRIKERRYKSAFGKIDAYRQGEDIRFQIKITGAAQRLQEYFNSQQINVQQGWLGNIRFRVRRNRSNDELAERTEFALIPGANEHGKLLASDDLENTPSEEEAKRFAQFIRLANAYGYFRSEVFSPESAEVLKEVRNNIVHWDEKNVGAVQIGEIALRDYIQDPRRVQTTLADLGEFVSYLFESAANIRE